MITERDAIIVAADLWSGADEADIAANPEYLAGQVQLIAQLYSVEGDDMEDRKETVERRIRAATPALVI